MKYMVSDNNGIKLEINNGKILEESPIFWKLNNTSVKTNKQNTTQKGN